MRIKRSHLWPLSVIIRPAAKLSQTIKQSSANTVVSIGETRNKARRKLRRNFHLYAPVLAVLVIGLIIALGNPDGYVRKQPIARLGGLGGVSVIDDVSAADIAARIAVGADLIVADNVQNLADSQKAQVDYATTEGAYLAKPQLVKTDAKTNKDIVKYVVKPGDTVQSIARKFGVTSDTVRWENQLIGNLVSVGKELTILPVSGIRYKVKDGDTIQSIAKRFQANEQQIIAFNDAEVGGISAGEYLIIPGGKQPLRRPSYFSSGYGFAFGSQPLYGGNGYSYGYCTWWVAERRAQIGKPIPRNLGNAVSWVVTAKSFGMEVSSKPRAGAVLWHKNSRYIAGGLGHVGFVESINPDGSITISDMNYPVWNVVSNRRISPNEFDQYLFIY